MRPTLAIWFFLTSPLLAGEDEASWDVENPPGPTFEIPIDVREGTWMNVDVSPDGSTIAFDLLGDIYTVSIEGGEAVRILSGRAWDMQPRFSPDGSRLAFTSDRGGGDNLWICKPDGSDPRPVTKESYRLLNSPAWTPDGRFLAGRKHFTSRRSLGAGEIWLYHASGGGGLQMTVKPTPQKDLGEPAFSPDGRYLYFSLDVTPGDTFEYSKDSNGTIYAIRRLDRETGEITTLVTGPGGAIRPTPSPDGKTLAFLRRVRFQTTLFLMDLESGEIRPVHDGMERDMQETWAIHGVYPTMAWTPDSRSIVFWARGRIRRLFVDTGEVREIPFHVRDARTATPALRFPVPVDREDEFDVKVLRWVRVSPDGDRVVYQALGHLYVKELPRGEPRRLTEQTDHFEFMPSFSRDGRSIVYVSFDDENLGAVRVVPAAGGEGRVVTSEPGHYVDPVFTPDGRQIVYGKVSGGGIVSPLWSDEPGLYRVPVEGGDPRLITKRGTDPHFGASSDRVYLLTVETEPDRDRRALISVDLDGSDERTHLLSSWATSFRVSPDGTEVAFTEGFQAHVAPFVSTGRTVEIGPDTEAIPVRRVSRDAGENLQWSSDGSRLYWSLGPELFSVEVGEETLTDDAYEPPEGTNISFRAKVDRPEGLVALVGGRVITMRGDEVIEDGVVIVDGPRIAAVFGRGESEIPPAARRIDCHGLTIVPGLIDVHAHGQRAVAGGVIPKRNWQLYANLAFGVTTQHDPSNDTNAIFATAELARAGLIVSPRTWSTGTILYGATGWFKAEVNSLDDARRHLRRLQAVGATTVKSYNQPRRDQRQQIVAAARELGMMVVPEGGSLLQHNLTFVVDGHTGVEHSLPVERIYQDIAQLWGRTAVGYTPTLIVGYGGIWGENYWYDKTDVWKNERLLRFTPRSVVDPRSRRREKAPDEEYNHLRSAGICKTLVDHGARCQLGAHGQLQGLGAHWELWMLHQGGLTPLEALRAATLDGAFYIGLDADLGSIESGKLADLVVLEGNPLEDIRNTEHIRYTMLNGRLYDARTMAREGEEPPEFWFDRAQAALPGATHAGCAGCTSMPPGPPVGYR